MNTVPFHVVIPARFQSSRFPGKLLMDLNGMSVIERVYRQALLAKPQSITVATDHLDIYHHVLNFGAHAVMTAATHQSGTDRIAEVVAMDGFAPHDIIVNVQGDEPLISPRLIEQVAMALVDASAPMATLCWPIQKHDEMVDPNIVKVVRNRHHHALYFSRSPIPFNREHPQQCTEVFRHIGLYAYRQQFLLEYVKWPVCKLENIEVLEQLRVLWEGHAIKVETACVAPMQDINTPDDLQKACLLRSVCDPE